MKIIYNMTCFDTLIDYTKEKIGGIKMNIEQIMKPDQWIVSITYTIPVVEIKHVIGPTFMKLVAYIQEQQAEIQSNPFVAYKNMDENGNVNADSVQMEVGFPINKKIAETEEVRSYFLPAFKALTAVFIGKYDDLTSPYLAILEEIKRLNGTFKGISYEYYLSDEEIAEDQQETLIEIPYE